MDRRQRKTREAIFTAFIELLSKKDFAQITVGEIINQADIGRATFYSHFETKDFLLKDKLVLSHNDFQRSNIIKDLDDNYYLIDFEFMANNVDLYDVACFGNDSILDGEELLKAYKDDAPSLDDFKKFYLWRMFISLQWHNVAIIKHFKGEGETHNINFLDVANHFLNNAIEVYKKYHLLEK